MKSCIYALTKPSHGICKRVCVFSYYFVNIYSSRAVQTLDFSQQDASFEFYYAELRHSLQGNATSGCIRKALETLNFMRNVPGKPTVNNYNALIRCNLKSEYVMLEDLVEVYVGMKRFGLYPNASTFNTLLNGMISHRKTRDAFFIAQEMCARGFVHSFTMFSKLLKKTLESRYLAYALSVFKSMLRFNYFPSEPTFNLLNVSLSKAGIMHEAYYVFSVALEKGYFRGAHSYNPILWALCKSGQSYTALELFYSFKKKGCGHNVCSYTALVYGFSRERLWKEAFRCLREMQTVSYKPNVRTYTAVVKFLCVDGRIQEALSLLDKMEKEACDPDLITYSYNIVLHELSHQSRVAEIYELVSVIDQKGLYPDPFTHSALVGGLLRAGKIGMSMKLLLDIISKRCTMDTVMYNSCFNIICHENKSSDSLSLMMNMIETGFKPNNVTYKTSLKGLCKENIEEALELFDCVK
ncbi:pentatricopeptide repeat-containing protein At5g16640, mitochondrial-like [Rhododendron vialii]|uniref:pentatricopeptide repeat-containing protein At5g16640, mitochondrial-like n=1 Tax=Rhododendron vialii TaxID=182163 RepID=UPI00265F7641|nr:pentatricopeptide repeat-containing protein At5g16640, mitochondrial-like [Rhododendron vialii]XP_058200710.1 pentatricopeptide repeat-containing protein At5g16640, mitochondrial-like [Rhododendron vialii]